MEKYWDILFYEKPDGKYQLNLWEANQQIFLDAGIKEEQISMPGICTCCNPHFLYSHRASHGKRENLGAFLSLVSKTFYHKILKKTDPFALHPAANRLSVFCQQLIDFLCRRLYFCNRCVVVMLSMMLASSYLLQCSKVGREAPVYGS